MKRTEIWKRAEECLYMLYAKAQGIIKTIVLYRGSSENVIDLNECQEIVKPLFGIVTKEYFEM